MTAMVRNVRHAKSGSRPRITKSILNIGMGIEEVGKEEWVESTGVERQGVLDPIVPTHVLTYGGELGIAPPKKNSGKKKWRADFMPSESLLRLKNIDLSNLPSAVVYSERYFDDANFSLAENNYWLRVRTCLSAPRNGEMTFVLSHVTDLVDNFMNYSQWSDAKHIRDELKMHPGTKIFERYPVCFASYSLVRYTDESRSVTFDQVAWNLDARSEHLDILSFTTEDEKAWLEMRELARTSESTPVSSQSRLMSFLEKKKPDLLRQLGRHVMIPQAVERPPNSVTLELPSAQELGLKADL